MKVFYWYNQDKQKLLGWGNSNFEECRTALAKYFICEHGVPQERPTAKKAARRTIQMDFKKETCKVIIISLKTKTPNLLNTSTAFQQWLKYFCHVLEYFTCLFPVVPAVPGKIVAMPMIF